MTDRQSRPCYWMLLDSQLQIKALPAELEKPEINSNLLDLIHNDDRPTFQKAIIDNPVFFKNLVGRKLVARVLGHIDDQFYSAEFRFLAINSQFIILFLHVEKSVSCTTFSTLGLQEKFQSVLESHIDIDPTTFRFFQLLDSASLDVLLAYPKGILETWSGIFI